MKLLDLIISDFEAAHRKFSYGLLLLDICFSYNMRPLILLRLRQVKGMRHFVKFYLRNKYQIEYSPNLILGSHFRIPHPRGIILAARKIGDNCLVGQYVTIGGNNLKSREKGLIKEPTVGNNVNIYAGAVVAGPIDIGNDVIIGANTTITKDVESHMLIYNSTRISRKSVIVPGYKGPFYYEN